MDVDWPSSFSSFLLWDDEGAATARQMISQAGPGYNWEGKIPLSQPAMGHSVSDCDIFYHSIRTYLSNLEAEKLWLLFFSLILILFNLVLFRSGVRQHFDVVIWCCHLQCWVSYAEMLIEVMCSQPEHQRVYTRVFAWILCAGIFISLKS